MTNAVLRTYTEVTPDFLTAALRASGWSEEAVVSGVTAETIGAGQMGLCARFSLEYGGEARGAPRSLIGKFAATDEQARQFMSATGYRNEVCFYQHFASRVSVGAPRCAYAAIDDEGWFTLLLEDFVPMQPGDQLRGLSLAQVESAVLALVGLHAPFWDSSELTDHDCFAGGQTHAPELLKAGLQAAVPGFLERYASALAVDEVAFYERFAASGFHWIAARGPARSLIHSDFRPDNLLFSADTTAPRVGVVDWQGFGAGLGLADVGFLIGNSLEPTERVANEERLVRRYHAALVAAGVEDYGWTDCWEDYARALTSPLITTIFGAMYGLRTERGDRMFELMGSRHARQILDLGADRFLGD